jgi:uncharacterized RDD family membrane protein YckC
MTTTTSLASVHSPELEGHYAGIVSRAAAFAVDLLTIALLFAIFGRVLEYVFAILLREPVSFSRSTFYARALLAVWAVIYLAQPLAASGRTFGMAVLGLRAVRADGSDIDGWHALLRVVALPLSFLLFGLGFLLILLRRDRRALQDLIASTAVVYAWDARAARLRFLMKH